jgi:hypothetical protein
MDLQPFEGDLAENNGKFVINQFLLRDSPVAHPSDVPQLLIRPPALGVLGLSPGALSVHRTQNPGIPVTPDREPGWRVHSNHLGRVQKPFTRE